MPLLVARSPFQQALVVQIGLNIKGLSVHTGTNVLPTGGVKWSVYGNDFVYGPLASSRMPQERSVGKYLVRGFVQDDHGVPIEGACVEIGKAIACTDDRGEFVQRESRSRSLALRVVPEDFLVPGRWEVVGDVPATVTAALEPETVKIVVRRR
jgi:protocatechuate 3,4-dioxygenase beta subunit